MNTKYKLLFVWFALLFFSQKSQATIYYADALNGADTNNGLFKVYSSGMDGPKQTIFACLTAASAGDTIMVAAGKYVETIDIDKPITLLGNNYDISAKGNRNAESILYPENVNINSPPGAGNSIMNLLSSQVTIKGFLFNGDNSELNSGNTIDTADVDIDFAIAALTAFDAIDIANNRFANFNTTALFLRGFAGSATIGVTIDHCSFKNFGASSQAISLTEDFAATITNSCFEMVDEAIYLGDFASTGTPLIVSVSNNDIKCRVSGIRYNNIAVEDISFPVFNNTIRSDDNAIADAAILLESCSDSTDIKSNQNYIHDISTGIQLSEHYAKPYTSTQDSIKDVDIGLHANNAGVSSVTTVINSRFTYIDSTAGNAFEINSDGNSMVLNIDNGMVNNSSSGIGATGITELTVENTAFTKILNNYIQIGTNPNGDAPSKEIDASSNSYEGITGSSLSILQAMVVEDKMLHVLDDPAFAFVNFKPMWLHVTDFSGNNSVDRASTVANDNWSIVVDTLKTNETVTLANDLNIIAPELYVGTFSMQMAGKTTNLVGNISLMDGLDLNGGFVNSQNATFTLGIEGSSEAANGITGGSDTSFVKGPLHIVSVNSARDTIFFPIGKGGDYRPATMDVLWTAPGDTSLLTGEMILDDRSNDAVDSTLTHVSTFRYWNFAHNGGGTVDEVYYTLSYDLDSTDDMVTNPIYLRTAVFDGSMWHNRAGSGSAPGKGELTSWFRTNIVGDVTIANAVNGANFLGLNRAISNFYYRNTCFGDSTLFRENSLSNGGNVIRWAWDFGDTSSNDTSSLMNPAYKYSGPGTYKVALTVQNDSGGINTVTMDVEITPLPVASFTDTIPCFPEPFNLDNTSTISKGSIDQNRWEVDTFTYLTRNASATIPDTGTYNIKLVVTSDNGCSDSTIKSVYYGDSVKISFVPPGPLSKCDYNTVDIDLSRAFRSHSWSSGDTTAKITVATGGWYTLTAQTSSHCIGTDSIQVIDIPRPSVEAGPDLQVDFGDRVQLQGSGNGSLLWTPSADLDDATVAMPWSSAQTTTMYKLTVIDANNCENSDSMTLTVVIPVLVRVNNMITPNSDGKNDYWDLSNVPGIDDATIVVMSRWGQEVFRSDNYRHDWDGTYEGEPLPEGTYIYILDVRGSDPKMYKGNLEIIR